jgi:CheY-like chemotaxis protein
LRQTAKSHLHRELIAKRIDELKARIPVGGLHEALIRALLYAGMARGGVDERGFEAVRRIRQAESDIPLSAFKAMVREQSHILRIDTEKALAAIPSLLPKQRETRMMAFALIKQTLRASGADSPEDRSRIKKLGELFELDGQMEADRPIAVAAGTRSPPANASSANASEASNR